MKPLMKLIRRVIGKCWEAHMQEIEHFDPSWSLRIKEMAKHIRDGESVLDWAVEDVAAAVPAE